MKDYGHNGRRPDGKFEMFPSLDIVTEEEKNKRLSYIKKRPKTDCFGLTWDEIEKAQGGKLNRNK
jgi:hypothetical protein